MARHTIQQSPTIGILRTSIIHTNAHPTVGPMVPGIPRLQQGVHFRAG
jgi:hypothetical protein